MPFWQLPYFIDMAERAGLAASGYRLQYPEAVGAAVHAGGHGVAGRGVQPAVLPLGRRAENGPRRRRLGFLLYIMSKLTDDLSKAELLPPMVAAWMPAAIGAMTGFVVLLYQEDG